MTGPEFRRIHGEPAQWTDDEYELFAECATPGDPKPAHDLLARLKTDRTKPADLTAAA
ncbi:hypothetical protein ACN6K5_003566 [Streptomyces violaceoruber]|uniref:hypothetical protein n=1 Tax=Streptomyces violaceoruber TaxID=1935 RepID=UPI00403C3022